ncbi:MAG: hypothetical protein AAGE80_15430 [Pseudomonadota bacterium]
MFSRSAVAWMACFFLATAVAACGGRTANPVTAQRDIDAKLSCANLQGELSFNNTRIADLTDEGDFADAQNLGLLLVGPLFLDFSDSQQTEIKALHARNQELNHLIDEKDCE